MAYRVVMELIPKPDNVENWKWDETNEERGTPQNGHADWKKHTGGYAWTAKLNSGDTIWEYDNESGANTKMAELDAADSTIRRYKVIEV
tara:strand:- start:182 stop:448 length:267 start_codon:yes stop_codon:yes gene_type:complete